MSSRNITVRLVWVLVSMLGVGLLTRQLTPPLVSYAPGSLASAIPTRFADWHEIKTDVAQINPAAGQATERSMDSPYDEVVMRSYANSHGEVVMLALAYGVNQRQEVKIHRPELCYVSQGFKLLERTPIALRNPQAALPVSAQRMLFQAPGRAEAVSYWIRIGNVYSTSAWATRYYIFKEGLKGHALDGVLVRVSQAVEDRSRINEALFARQEAFMADLTRAMAPRGRALLLVLPDPAQPGVRG